MFVCICQGVTKGQIGNSISAGAKTLKALRQELGVMSCCGKCAAEIRKQLSMQSCPNSNCGDCCACAKP